MDEWEEIKPWDEAPKAHGPMKSSLSLSNQQIETLIDNIKPELFEALGRALEDPEYKQRWVEEVRGGEMNPSPYFFRIGSLKSKGRFGVRLIRMEAVNPIRQFVELMKPLVWYRRQGYFRYLRLPCIKIIWALKRRDS